MDLVGYDEHEQLGQGRSHKGSHDGPPLSNPEMIPMSDFRSDKGENLRKIHAQSSAETSGLGDSLQRIHTLSSTETSGYGDTVPSPTAPSPSPEAFHDNRGLHEPGYGFATGQQSPVLGSTMGSRSPISQTDMGQDRVRKKYAVGVEGSPKAATKSKGKGKADSAEAAILKGAIATPEFVSLAKPKKRGENPVKRVRPHRHASPPPPDLTARLPDNAAASIINSSPYHKYYRQSDNEQTQDTATKKTAQRPKLQRSQDLDEGIDGEFGEMDTYSPTQTPPLGTGKGKGGKRKSSQGDFLGKDLQGSTWLTWSKDRRTSLKKRMDSMEKRHKEIEQNRVSTPVRKARKESVMFVTPELEDTHLSLGEEPPFPVTVPLPTDGPTTSATGSIEVVATNPVVSVAAPVVRKSRRPEQDIKVDVKLSEYQMNMLTAYWEHNFFNNFRITGMLISLIGCAFVIAAGTNGNWSRIEYPGDYVEISGLWQNCSSNFTITSELDCSITPWPGFNAGIWNICFYNVTRTKTEAICSSTHHYWQNAVIGLLIFSVAFGFLATVLSICGFITTQLAKKIYYYHSAGEIYLICAMSCIAALVVYPVALEVDDEYGIHSFGVGYGLGWGASFFFITSALCMCLDDLVRAFARGACRCCGRNNENDTRV